MWICSARWRELSSLLCVLNMGYFSLSSVINISFRDPDWLRSFLAMIRHASDGTRNTPSNVLVSFQTQFFFVCHFLISAHRLLPKATDPEPMISIFGKPPFRSARRLILITENLPAHHHMDEAFINFVNGLFFPTLLWLVIRKKENQKFQSFFFC